MVISNYFKKFYFLLSILFLSSNCYIKIPITYYPYFIRNLSNPSNIIQYYINQRAYLNFEVGNPKQKIQIPLVFDTNNFYITDADIFTNDTKLFSGFSLYNFSKSLTNIEISYYDSYDCDYFQFASYNSEQFFFNNKNYSLEFFGPYESGITVPGGIGMLLDPNNQHDDNKKRKDTFFGQLKSNKLIEDYYWSIFYNSKEKNIKEEEGFILIGKQPHEIDSDLGYYKNGNFQEKDKINFYIKNFPNLLFETDLLYAYEGTNKNKVIEDFPTGVTSYKTIRLDYHSGAVQIPKSLQPYYHRVFEQYIIDKQCFNETIKNNYDFYYCKKDKDIINKIKNVFPGINFRSQDLNYNLTLEADDLFIEENDYIFFLIYFPKSENDRIWKMGKPFLKKYQFSFNNDQTFFSFYNKLEQNEKKSGGINTGIFVLAIFATIIVVVIICFIIFKFFIFEKFFRKKRANELEDNDYEYTPNNDKKEELFQN